jgi:hypothetical protein
VFAGVQAAVAYDIFSPNPRWGGTTLQLTPRPSVVDTGQPFYVGTMVLDVPETASGTYTIPFVPIASFMTDALGGEIRIIRATPVHIRVAPDCCLPDGSCAAIMPEMCVAGGGVLGACAGDCDGNGIDEGCGLFADCNDSGLPDSCDIAGGTSSDEDGNCIPDECDAEPAPIAEANGVFKNRFISFQTTIAGCETAIRVELVSLNHPDPPSTAGVAESDFSAFEGEYRWVGPPEVLEESVRPLSYFNAAALRCEPYFMDWSSVGLIHVYGTEIVPSSTYNVQFVDVSCDNWNDPACGMKTLRINTGRWGDVVAPFHAADGGSQPDFSDIAAIVDKFVRLPFPLTASAELNPNLPNPAQFIDFRDVSAAVDAFGGMPYPYAGPDKCP